MKKNNVYILEDRGLLYISGEDCKEFLQNIVTNDINKVQIILKENDVDFFVLGQTNSSSNLNLKDIATISIDEIRDINEKTIPSMMGDE